jgi:hypothetical protein
MWQNSSLTRCDNIDPTVRLSSLTQAELPSHENKDRQSIGRPLAAAEFFIYLLSALLLQAFLKQAAIF